MTTPTIPSGLKPIVQNYTIGAPDGVARTEVAGGAPRYALDYDRGVQQYRVTLPMTALQFAVWTSFFHHIIKKGALSFNMQLNSGYGVQTHTVDIVPGSYSATPDSGGADAVWTVSFLVEAESSTYAMTDDDAQALIDLYELEGEHSGELLQAINQFANFDTLVLQL
jgi:hypothetical protein